VRFRRAEAELFARGHLPHPLARAWPGDDQPWSQARR
jgi:hypothetical protein